MYEYVFESIGSRREVNVVDSHSTARRLWFSCGPPPGPAFGTKRKYSAVLATTAFWTHLSSPCVHMCISGDSFCVRVRVRECVHVCCSTPLCCTLCPWYFKVFWPHVMSVCWISRLQLRGVEWGNPCGGQEEWGERKERRVIEGFRVILRPRMAVSTCLHNLLKLII